MGVPKFAAWLTKKYPAMVIDRCPADVHGLYIDLNGLIHPCCHDEHDKTVALRTELEKLRSICLAIETLMVTVRPQHVLYIAIDGVAPRAKMNQQRARRYMSAAAPLTNTEKPIHGGSSEISAGVVAAIEKEFTSAERDGAEKELEGVSQALLGDPLYGGGLGAEMLGPEAEPPATATAVDTGFVPTLGSDSEEVTAEAAPKSAPKPVADTQDEAATNRFDSNCISPGTVFMERVAAAVRDFVKRKVMAAAAAAEQSGAPAASTPSSPWANLTVVFSDSNTAGEGEHKFLDFLRTQSAFPGFNGGGCHVIAGLDADLIFLSLSLHIPRVVILRDHDRSSYEKALLPVSAGGTLVPVADKKKNGANALPSSSSTSSIGSAAAAGAEEPIDEELSSITPASHREGIEAPKKDGDASIIDDAVDSSSATPASPPASPAPPQSIATVVADVCTSYEYYDIDVVGAALVSEVYQLSLEKGVQIKGDPLATPANCIASNGFNFHQLGSHAANTAATAASPPSAEPKEGERKDSKPKPSFHPCTATSNSKVVDDFVVLGMLLGNDFLPHLPSVYCGESAMDTVLDVYVSAVLPYGYLTGGQYDIQLLQLERFFRAYAAVEALRFRQYAIQSGVMTPQEAATPELCSAADRRCWRDTYIRTTSLRHEAGVQDACRAYVEGLRFVWRYYSSISLQVSWSWYYPFHHAPLALDVADFLKAQGPGVQTALAAPKLERAPPPPFCQLLCILPPTSRQLVPAALRPSMLHPPQELRDTFPKQWQVDNTGAYGKDHLAVIVLPFANLPKLQELVVASEGTYTEEERQRNALRSTHIVLESRARETATGAAEATATEGQQPTAAPSTATTAASAPKGRSKRAAAAHARGFHIQGEGLHPLAAADTPADLLDCPSISCASLADIVPPLSRPRTYSYTVPIPNLTILPDGTRVPVERRPESRYGNRRRRGAASGGGRGEDRKDGARTSSSAAAAGAAAAGNHGEAATKPPMLFGEFLLALLGMGLLTAAVTAYVSRASLWSFTVLFLQLCGVALAVVGLAFAMGLAVASKGRTAGSGLHRHNIFTAFADWQCAACLSLNFSRNRRCFICRAPYDPTRCVALFSGRNAPEPPLMDPNHDAYAACYGITSL